MMKVVTEASLKKVLQRLGMFGHLVNLSIKLRIFNIDYVPRMTIKWQVLVDFVSKMTGPP